MDWLMIADQLFDAIVPTVLTVLAGVVIAFVSKTTKDAQAKTENELADKYLDVFCEKSGIAKSNVQRWIPIVAATQMTKGKEEEQEFLSRWIEVVDYE